MDAKLKLLLLSPILLSISCKISSGNSDRAFNKNLRNSDIKFFKMQVYCSCLKNAYQNDEIMKSIGNEDLLAYSDNLNGPDLQKTVDSLGKIVAKNIKPEEYADFEEKKRITV